METIKLIESIHQKIMSQYTRTHKDSGRLYSKGIRYFPDGNTRSAAHFPPFAPYMTHGKGCYVYDEDNKRYLDFLNNYGSLILGHCHPKVVTEMSRQLTRGTVFGAPTANQIRLAGLICKRMPSIEKIRFTNSGTEAAMYAVRLARAFTRREKIIKIIDGYHGTYDDVIYNGEKRVTPHGLTGETAKNVILVPYNSAELVEKIISRHKKQIACLIVEPMLGAGGMIPAQSDYLQRLRELTSANNIILIFDEVLTFRLALGGAQELFGIRPDLTILGKMIGGGFPIGAVGGRNDIMQLLSEEKKGVFHSGTFNGNEASMVCGYITLKELTKKNIQRLNALGDTLRRQLFEIMGRYLRGIKITGAGSFCQIHFNVDSSFKRKQTHFFERLTPLFHIMLLNKGVFLSKRCAFFLSIPMTERHINYAVQKVADVLEELKYITRKADIKLK